MDEHLGFNGSLPSLVEFQEIFFYESVCIDYLFCLGVFPNRKLCSKCGKTMTLEQNLEKLRCRDKNCRKRISVRKGTIFETKKLPCSTVLLLSCLWLNKV